MELLVVVCVYITRILSPLATCIYCILAAQQAQLNCNNFHELADANDMAWTILCGSASAGHADRIRIEQTAVNIGPE